MKCSRRPWYSKKKSESHRAMEKPENLQTSNCSRLQQVHGWCGPNSCYSQSIVFTSWRDTKFPTMVKAKERETCYCLSKSLWEPLLPETRQPKGKDKICPQKIVWQMWAHTYPSRVKRIVNRELTQQTFAIHGGQPELKLHKSCALRMSHGRRGLSRRAPMNFSRPCRFATILILHGFLRRQR